LIVKNKNMANKRMFSKQITTSDAFVDMPVSSQLLYFHLNMEADDDGFVANPKRIVRMLGGGDDDLKVLLMKRFLIGFEGGVVVIKHWLLHNAVRKDMYRETQYLDEKKQLKIKDNGVYTEVRNESVTLPLHRIDKVRLDKDRIDKIRGEETPSQKMESFVLSSEENSPQFQELVVSIEARGVPREIAESELRKFISYWTEKNKSGTKQRWQMQETFEVQRRLATWFSKVKEFNQNKPANKYQIKL
jgi:hypothetical protein